MGMGSASLGLWYYGERLGRWVYTTVIKFKSLVRHVDCCIPRIPRRNIDVNVTVGIAIAIDVGPPCTVVTHVTHIICKLPFLHMHTAHAPCIPGRLLPRLHVCHRYCLPPAPAARSLVCTCILSQTSGAVLFRCDCAAARCFA